MTLTDVTPTEATLTSAAGRAVLLRALWRHAAEQISERFDDMLYAPAGAEEVKEIDRRIAGLLRVRRAIAVVEDAKVGETVEMDGISAAELNDELRSVAQSISEDDSFWELEAEQRGVMLAEHDAALALALSLAVEAQVA